MSRTGWGREVHINGDLRVHLFSWTPNISRRRRDDWQSGLGQGTLGGEHRTTRGVDPADAALSWEDYPALRRVRSAGYPGHPQRERRSANWDIGTSEKGMRIPLIHHFIVRDGHLKIDDRVLQASRFSAASRHEENAGGGDQAFQPDRRRRAERKQVHLRRRLHGGALIHVEENKPLSRFTADIHSGTTHVTADGALRRLASTSASLQRRRHFPAPAWPISII